MEELMKELITTIQKGFDQVTEKLADIEMQVAQAADDICNGPESITNDIREIRKVLSERM